VSFLALGQLTRQRQTDSNTPRVEYEVLTASAAKPHSSAFGPKPRVRSEAIEPLQTLKAVRNLKSFLQHTSSLLHSALISWTVGVAVSSLRRDAVIHLKEM
jgi:hypothetical protein